MVYVGGAAGAHADDVFIAFARVFSGALRPGSGGVLHVRLHGGGGASGGGEERTLEVDGLRLYRLMGRELVRVEEAAPVPALGAEADLATVPGTRGHTGQ